MDIQLNIDVLKKNNLTVSEYLYLRNLYVTGLDKISDLHSIIDRFSMDRLEAKGFIKISEEDGIVLRRRGRDLFDPESIMDKFIVLFPTKTPIKKRYLSPTRLEGVAYNKIKTQWNRIFKNDQAKAQKAYDVLEAEIRMRQQTPDGLEFMNAIEVWLNQANYEKYEYLLDEEQSPEDNAGNYNDWL